MKITEPKKSEGQSLGSLLRGEVFEFIDQEIGLPGYLMKAEDVVGTGDLIEVVQLSDNPGNVNELHCSRMVLRYPDARLVLQPEELDLVVTLTKIFGKMGGDSRIQGIREIRRFTGLGLREAKDLADLLPSGRPQMQAWEGELGILEAKMQSMRDDHSRKEMRLQDQLQAANMAADQVKRSPAVYQATCEIAPGNGTNPTTGLTLGGLLDRLQVLAKDHDMNSPVLMYLDGLTEIDAVDHATTLALHDPDPDSPAGATWEEIQYGQGEAEHDKISAIVLS